MPHKKGDPVLVHEPILYADNSPDTDESANPDMRYGYHLKLSELGRMFVLSALQLPSVSNFQNWARCSY